MTRCRRQDVPIGGVAGLGYAAHSSGEASTASATLANNVRKRLR